MASNENAELSDSKTNEQKNIKINEFQIIRLEETPSHSNVNENSTKMTPNTKIKPSKTNETQSAQIEFNREHEFNDMLKHLRNETVKLFLKVFQVNNKWIRIYLIFLLLLCMSISAYMLVILISSYLEFEVLTTTIVLTETKSVFPKITICNFNPFQTEYALEYLKEINMRINSSVNIFDAEQREKLSQDELIELTNDIYEGATLYMISLNFTDEQRQKLGHSLTDLISNFHFDYYGFSPSEYFDWYFDRYYGNCYIFNSGFNNTQLNTINVPGADGSLKFDYYVNFHENLTAFNSFTGGFGAVIRIENNSYLIDTSLVDKNIRVMPGTDVSIKISRSFQFSLPKPYSTCDIPNDDQDMFIRTNYFFRLFANSIYQYTREACYVQCWQQNLINKCSCMDSSYLSFFNEDFCFTDEQLNCSSTFWIEFTWDTCLDVCPLECNQTIYKTDVSSLQILGDYYVYTIKENPVLANDFVTQEMSADLGAKSFVHLKLYYETLSYEKTYESPKMDVVDLLSNIGGNLSLFLGLSIFTLFELIEIILESYFLNRK